MYYTDNRSSWSADGIATCIIVYTVDGQWVMNVLCKCVSRTCVKQNKRQLDNKQYCRLSVIREGDEVFGIHLSVVKYHVYIGLFHVIDNRVVQWQRFLVSDWRFHQLWSADLVAASQHSALEYVLSVAFVWWRVYILSWVSKPSCKVHSFAICSRYTETRHSNIMLLVYRQQNDWLSKV